MPFRWGKNAPFWGMYHSEQAQALLQEARQVFPDAVLTQIESTYAVGGK